MVFLLLVGVGIVGTVFPLVNPEVTATLYGREGLHPALIGVALGAGQVLVYTLTFVAGERLLPRLPSVQALVTRTRERYASHLDRNFLVLAFFGGIVGIPPALALAALAPGFLVRLVPLILVLYPARIVRFALLANAGSSADGLWTWVKQLWA